MPSEDAQLSRGTALMLVILAVVQSALLLLLHKAIIHEFWPATDPRWLYALYTLFVGLPLFLYLGVLRWDDRYNLTASALLAVILFWLGWHAGWLALPYTGEDGGNPVSVIGQLIPVGLLLVFMAGFMFRGWREAGDWRAAPRHFLPRSWDNALTLLFLHLYLLVFCLLLTLWAALFSLINIEFFVDLFTTAEFIYPVTGLVGGLGLVIIRQRLRFISTVRYMCEALIRALLPLAAFILLLFLAALPFTGLQPLWDTGAGTLLLMVLAALILFSFNADFGGGRTAAYPRVLDWLVRAGIIALPINLALAGWGLWLRVGQHGWTVSRYWALFIILILSAFALAYLADMARAALRRQTLHYAGIERWNAGLGIALLLALVLVNTGILDFRKLAANDQVDRLHAGKITATEFDADYLRFKLGHYGQRTLVTLRDESDDPALVARIDETLARRNRWSRPAPEAIPEDEQALQAYFTLPEETDVPDSLLRDLMEESAAHSQCLSSAGNCRIILLEVGEEDWWVLLDESEQWMRHSRIARRADDDTHWLNIGNLDYQSECPARWQDAEDTGEVELITEPSFFLRLGQCAYRIELRLEPRPLVREGCKGKNEDEDEDEPATETVAAKPCHHGQDRS